METGLTRAGDPAAAVMVAFLGRETLLQAGRCECSEMVFDVSAAECYVSHKNRAPALSR